MAVPEMVPGDVIRALVRRIESLERALRESASTGRTIESTTVGAGGIKISGGGGLTVVDGGDVEIGEGGTFRTYGSLRAIDAETLATSVYFGTLSPADIYRSGLLVKDPEDENVIFWAAKMADGGTQIQLDAARSGLRGERVELHTTDEQMLMYGLPTTTESGNLRIQVVSGEPRLYYGNASNEALKDDLVALDVEPADVLAIEVMQWSEGDRTVIGVTAEQVGQIGSVAPLLVRPRHPEGQSVEYDRIPILHHVVLRDHDERLDELEATVQAQAQVIEDLKTRLEALEADA